MTSCILLLSHWSTLALSSGLKHKTVSRQDCLCFWNSVIHRRRWWNK